MEESITEFETWVRRVGFKRPQEIAEALGISRQSVAALRAGRQKPSPPMKKLMELIEERSIEDRGDA